MEQFETLDCEKKTCRFQYLIEKGDDLNPDKIHFKVFLNPENPYRWFTYSFQIVDNNTAKGEMMSNNGYVEFAKKGIPERIIEIASNVLKRNIISSPFTPQAGNYLVGPSYKAWERLVNMNENALKDVNNNCFVFNYKP